uniref:Uncharacterized protein n=1 Tax=Glossina austeni TaxID=7395 RepID=A0A1A9UD27_GLOAU
MTPKNKEGDTPHPHALSSSTIKPIQGAGCKLILVQHLVTAALANAFFYLYKSSSLRKEINEQRHRLRRIGADARRAIQTEDSPRRRRRGGRGRRHSPTQTRGARGRSRRHSPTQTSHRPRPITINFN